MSIHHYRKTSKGYTKALKSDRKMGECPFCIDRFSQEPDVGSYKTMRVVNNRTKYDIFDAAPVTDHLMVVPLKHHKTISTFSDAERKDWFSAVAEYEQQGYHIFSRGQATVSRSVEHVHTHLIKIGDVRVKNMLYLGGIDLLLTKFK